MGRKQAAALVGALSGRDPPAALYSSPLPRALETAAPLCHRLGVEPVVDPRLTEFAMADGTLESVLERPDLVIWRADHRGIEHGETLREFSARVAAFCDEVAVRHRGGNVVIFTHSGTIDAAIRWAVGLTADSHWQHDFNLTNASITEIVFWPHGRVTGGAPRYAALLRIGDCSHLRGLSSDT